MRQVAQDPQIVDWMNIASDNLGERTHPRAIRGIPRQKWRIGVGLIEIFDDCQRLNQSSLTVLQGRHQALGVDGQIIGLDLVIAPQMDGHGLVVELFQIEGDADAERGRGTKIAVELHHHLTPPGQRECH